MECRKLNEETYGKIVNAMEGIKATTGTRSPTYFKALYSPATLMNNWFEERASDVEPKESEPLVSENMDNYRSFCTNSLPDRKEYFNKVFESYGLGQELFLDHLGFSYYENYVSSYDLSYNHLTKGLCGPLPRHYQKGHYLPETDLSRIYGNLTQWGLKEKVYQSMRHGQCMEPGPISESAGEFVAHDLNEVKKLNDFQNFKRVKVTY